jgi:hypothetical protein
MYTLKKYGIRDLEKESPNLILQAALQRVCAPPYVPFVSPRLPG